MPKQSSIVKNENINLTRAVYKRHPHKFTKNWTPPVRADTP